jgi:hypothetical protein
LGSAPARRARQLGEEFARAGLGDGPEVSDHFLAAHADAVVGNGQGFSVLVEGNPYLEIRIALEQGGVVQRFETQLVAGVGRIGNQLAKENLAVGVQRVDHQLQELLDLGLEAEGFFGSVLSRGGHRKSPEKRSVPARYGVGQGHFKSRDKSPRNRHRFRGEPRGELRGGPGGRRPAIYLWSTEIGV